MLAIPEDMKTEVKKLWPDFSDIHSMVDSNSPELLSTLGAQVLKCYATVLDGVDALTKAPAILNILQSNAKLFRARLDLYQALRALATTS